MPTMALAGTATALEVAGGRIGHVLASFQALLLRERQRCVVHCVGGCIIGGGGAVPAEGHLLLQVPAPRRRIGGRWAGVTARDGARVLDVGASRNSTARAVSHVHLARGVAPNELEDICAAETIRREAEDKQAQMRSQSKQNLITAQHESSI